MSQRGSRRLFRKDEFWREEIARQAASGLSIEAYCRQQGLAGSTFWRKHQQLAQRMPGQRDTPASAGAGAFIELRPASPVMPGGLTIHLPSGISLQLSGAYDLQMLDQVIGLCMHRR